MKKCLIVVDYQNDFVSGSLGFEKAKELKIETIGLDARVPAIEFYKRFNFKIVGEEHISPKSGMPIIRMEFNF